MIGLIRCGLAIAVLATPLAARAAGPPPAVAAYAQQLVDRCHQLGGQAASAPPRRADLNGDGLDDWLIQEGPGDCVGSAAGPGGGQVTIFVGQADGGALPSFQQGIHGLRIERARGKPTLWLAVSGRLCGASGAQQPAIRCDRLLVWKPDVGAFAFDATVRTPSRIAP